MSSTRFGLFILLPIMLSYLVPLLVYEMPLKIRTGLHIHQLSPKDIAAAVLVCTLWFGIVIGLVRWRVKRLRWETATRDWNPKMRWVAFLWFSIFGSLLSIVHYYFIMPTGFEEFVHVLSLMPTLGMVLGLYCLRDSRREGDAGWKTWIVVTLLAFTTIPVIIIPVTIAHIGPIAFSAAAILYGINVMGLAWWRQVVVGCLLAFIIVGTIPFKSDLRVMLYGGMWKRVPIAEYFTSAQKKKITRKVTPKPKVVYSFAGYWTTFSEYDPNYWLIRGLGSLNTTEGKSIDGGHFSVLHYAVAKALYRINHLGALGYIIRVTGKDIPFAEGQTYYPLLTKLIPRVLWKDKPLEHTGNSFGRRYGILHSSDKVTSVNLPIIVEGYMNWGWYGVVFSALFVGLVLRLVWAFWIGNRRAVGNNVLGMVVVLAAINQESNLSLVMGGVFHNLIVYWCIDVLIRYWYGGKQHLVQEPVRVEQHDFVSEEISREYSGGLKRPGMSSTGKIVN